MTMERSSFGRSDNVASVDEGANSPFEASNIPGNTKVAARNTKAAAILDSQFEKGVGGCRLPRSLVAGEVALVLLLLQPESDFWCRVSGKGVEIVSLTELGWRESSIC